MGVILRGGPDAFGDADRGSQCRCSYRLVGSMDDGFSISYKALRRGTPVRSSDGVEVGRVRRVLDNARENIFDGIIIETPGGPRFVDAPEVEHIAERAVTLTITAEQVKALSPPRSLLKERFDQAPLVRRTRRAGRDLKRRWGNR
jgi:hypothetical protein